MSPRSKIPHTVNNTNQLRSMARRRGIELRTRSQSHKSASEALNSVSSEINGTPGKEYLNRSEPSPKSKVNIPLANPDKPSTDLRPKPKGIIRWIKYLPGRIRNFKDILFPIPTPEELERKEFLKLERKRNKLAIKECRKYGKLISEKLAQLGEREVIGNNTPDKPRKFKKIRFSLFSRDELFTKLILRVDTKPGHLPVYVRLSDLGRREFYSDEMLPTLAHFMEFKSDEAGVFAIVYRHGLDGLPEFVAAEDIWKKVPENKPPLTFPVGYGDNSARFDVDLDDCPHIIVAGATKQGKSNFINQIVCFWLYRGLTPQDLQLILFDLKLGMEFCYYAGLPHLYRDDPEDVRMEKEKLLLDPDKYEPSYIETGIIEDLDGVMPAFLRLRKIMNKRLQQIKHAGYKDFNSYNRAQFAAQKRLPYMVVIIDEWARISLSLGEEPQKLVAHMTNLARAAGIYFILGTQNPNVSVISNRISVNFSTRVVFKCSVGGSLAALSNQMAAGLEEKGRAILQDGGDNIKLQTPRISDGLIKAVVFKAITGKDKKSFSPVDMEEILQYSLDHFDGALDITKIYGVFRDKKVKWEWLFEALRDSEGKEFILSGTSYRIIPAGYHKGRSLERMDMGVVSTEIANSKSQI